MGVAESVDDRCIREAYKQLALRHHPDKCHTRARPDSGQEDFAAIAAAYKTLSNPVARRSYDTMLLNDRVSVVVGVLLQIILNNIVFKNKKKYADGLIESKKADIYFSTISHNVFQQRVSVRTVDLLARTTLYVPEKLSLHRVRRKYVFWDRTKKEAKVVHLDVDQSADDNIMVDLDTGDVHVDFYAPLNDLLSGAKVALGLPGERLLEFDLQPHGRTHCVPFSGHGLLCEDNEQPGTLYVHILLVLPPNVPPYILKKHFASIEAATATDKPVLVFRSL